MTKDKRRCLMVMALIWFSIYSYVPQLSAYARELGASYAWAGLIGGAYGLTQTFVRIPLGIFSDILGKQKRFILWATFFAFLSSALIFFFPSPHMLFFGRLLSGFAAASWINLNVLFIGYFSQEEIPRAIGILNGVNRGGMMGGIICGALITLLFPMRSLFFLSMGSALVAMGAAFFLQESPSRRRRSSFCWKEFGHAVREKEFLYYSILGFVSQLITYGTTFGFTPLIARDMGASSFELSLLTMSFLVPQLFFAPLAGGRLLERLGEKQILWWGFFLMLLTSFPTPFVPHRAFLYPLQFVAGISSSLTFVVASGLVMRQVPATLRSSVTGAYQALYGAGALVGPILLGLIADGLDLEMGYFCMTGICLGTMVLISFHDRRRAAW